MRDRSLRRRIVLASGAGLVLGAVLARADGPPAAPVAPAPPLVPSSPAPPAPAPPSSATAPDPAPARDPLLLGEFALGERAVIDGDTLRLPAGALARSVRVACVDAEEIWHEGEEADRAAALTDFDAYARAKRGASRTPVKFGTPAGEAAAAFARAFFSGLATMRLERDAPGRDFDGHGRLLAHVIVRREGKDVLFAEALVRAGLSPYFVKYGRSRRFDAALVAAQREARAAGRGIWGKDPRHYADYDERLAWWETRAKQVDAWRVDREKPENAATFVELGVAADSARLSTLLGRTVTVFGSLDHVDAEGEPRRILLVDQPHRPFPLVVFDGRVWSGIDLAPIEASFVRVTGTLSEYRGRVQMKIEHPEAISTR